MRDGRELAEYTCCWIKGHWPTYKRIMHIAHRATERGERLSGPEVYYWARDNGIDISDMDGIRRDKTLWAGIARYMVMMRPKLYNCLEFRKSKMDKVDMVAVWHENVNPETFFFARDWKEAKHLCEIGDVSAQ